EDAQPAQSSIRHGEMVMPAKRELPPVGGRVRSGIRRRAFVLGATSHDPQSEQDRSRRGSNVCGTRAGDAQRVLRALRQWPDGRGVLVIHPGTATDEIFC
ncbi:MAG: hypothetical protein AVDCRST_MAG42-2821, partial [uncultured Chthoniobacterales bacterium]